MKIDDADILMDAEICMQKNECRKIKRTALASSEDEEKAVLELEISAVFSKLRSMQALGQACHSG